jgi:hypothetical protein
MRCPKCNYNNRDGSAVCNLCGELLHTEGRNYYQRFRQVSRASADRKRAEPPSPVAHEAGADPKSLTYLLVCFPLDPVALEPGMSYTIGRAAENDIIFPVGQISREHARIEWKGDGFELVDLDSHNGTFVNGETIDRRGLRYGDQVKIGPYLLEFYTARPGDKAPAEAKKKAMEATQDISLGEGNYEVGPFSGRLSDIELKDIARLLNMTKKTGMLEVRTPSGTGEIHFQDGEIVHAKWEEHDPMTALGKLLVTRDGSFRFLREAPGVRRTLEGPTSKILIEALRLGARNP